MALQINFEAFQSTDPAWTFYVGLVRDLVAHQKLDYQAASKQALETMTELCADFRTWGKSGASAASLGPGVTNGFDEIKNAHGQRTIARFEAMSR